MRLAKLIDNIGLFRRKLKLFLFLNILYAFMFKLWYIYMQLKGNLRHVAFACRNVVISLMVFG